MERKWAKWRSIQWVISSNAKDGEESDYEIGSSFDDLVNKAYYALKKIELNNK